MSDERLSILDRLRLLLPANRVAAASGVIVGFTTFLATLDTNLVAGTPASEPIGKGIALLGSLVLVLKAVDKFLDGQQNWDALEATVRDEYENVKDTLDDDPSNDPSGPGDIPPPPGVQTHYDPSGQSYQQ